MFKKSPFYIITLITPAGEQQIPVFDKRFMMGRKASHPVSISENSISRDHLEVVYKDGLILICDQGTSNGSKLNEQSLSPKVETVYEEGLPIKLGLSETIITMTLVARDKKKNGQIESASIPHSQPVGDAIATFASPAAPNPPVIPSPVIPLNQPNPFTPPPSSPIGVPKPQTAPAYSASAATPASPPEFVNAAATREEANKIIAKARVDAEITSRDILKSREARAVEILSEAERKANLKIKEAELFVQKKLDETNARVQNQLQAQNIEFEKLKSAILDEARLEKSKILANVENEKQVVIFETNMLREQVPQLITQIERKKEELRNFELERAGFTQAQEERNQKLAALNNEVESKESALAVVEEIHRITQEKVRDAEDKYNKTVLSLQTLIQDTKDAREKVAAREAELQLLIDTALVQKENSDNYAQQKIAETDQLVAAELERLEKAIKNKNETSRKFLDEEREVQEAIVTRLKKEESDKIKSVLEMDSIIKGKTERLDAELLARRQNFEKEMTEKYSQIETDWNLKIAGVEKEFQQKKIERTQQFNDIKAQQDAHLLETKQAEEKKLKEFYEEAKRSLREKKEQKIRNITGAVESYLAQMQGEQGQQEVLQQIRDSLTKIVEDGLNDQLAGEDTQLRRMLDHNPGEARRAKKSFQVMMGAGAALVVLVFIFITWPHIFREAPKRVREEIKLVQDEEAKKQRESQEQIRMNAIYRPQTTEGFHKTYTENILYTTRYLDFEYDEKSHSEWIQALNNFLQNEIKIKDDQALQFINNEFNLLKNLESLKATIDSGAPEKGIKKMEDTEEEYQRILSQTLKSKKEQFWVLKKQYYDLFQKENRKPASPASH